MLNILESAQKLYTLAQAPLKDGQLDDLPSGWQTDQEKDCLCLNYNSPEATYILQLARSGALVVQKITQAPSNQLEINYFMIAPNGETILENRFIPHDEIELLAVSLAGQAA